MSGVNSLIVRVSDRDELLREACRLAIEHGRFEWLGWRWVQPGTVKLSFPWHGRAIVLNLAEACGAPMGRPARLRNSDSAAMRLQQPIACNELEAECQRCHFAQEMLERGYHAVVALAAGRREQVSRLPRARH